MMSAISLIAKDNEVYCEKEKGPVNIHSMTHPKFKTKISEVCDSWKPDCPPDCRYFNQSKK